MTPPTTAHTADPLATPLDRMRIPRITWTANPTRKALFRPGATGLSLGITSANQAQIVATMLGSSGGVSSWATEYPSGRWCLPAHSSASCSVRNGPTSASGAALAGPWSTTAAMPHGTATRSNRPLDAATVRSQVGPQSERTSDWANADDDSRATSVRTPKPVPPLDR